MTTPGSSPDTQLDRIESLLRELLEVQKNALRQSNGSSYSYTGRDGNTVNVTPAEDIPLANSTGGKRVFTDD